ncbi:hypothetical protein GCM10007161_09920 [Ignatzschineria indica]|nr:hypothetical protein [Ignatzschineria indica]GGZ80267.1 hypothetical protein GCM10007161_09920 [Ignatzschineria indica]
MQEALVGMVLFLLLTYGALQLLRQELKVAVKIEQKVISFSLREEQLDVY